MGEDVDGTRDRTDAVGENGDAGAFRGLPCFDDADKECEDEEIFASSSATLVGDAESHDYLLALLDLHYVHYCTCT